MNLTVKYLSNEKGEKTDVVVPIDKWKDIQKKLGDIKSSFDPSKYRRMLKLTKEEIDDGVSQMRKEWD